MSLHFVTIGPRTFIRPEQANELNVCARQFLVAQDIAEQLLQAMSYCSLKPRNMFQWMNLGQERDMRVIFVVDDFGHDSQIAGGSMIVGLAFLRFELSYHDYVARTFLVRRDGMWLTPSFIPQLFEKAMIEAQKEQASLFTLELYSDEPNAREALNTWNPTSPLLSHSRQTSFKIELSKHPLPIG